MRYAYLRFHFFPQTSIPIKNSCIQVHDKVDRNRRLKKGF